MNKQIELLLPQIEKEFAGFEENGNLEVLIGKKLTSLGKTLATAESCTGGKIAERITANSGASVYFKGSVVSYATQAKIDVLNISEDLIDKYSVVSIQVAEAMAKSVQKLFKTDYTIATTGNAGPTKGDSNVEVGTVCIAIATPNGVFSEIFNLGNHRTKVINKAVNKAFEMLQKEIFKN
jgi:nicotinamide-nucleotide amidase